MVKADKTYTLDNFLALLALYPWKQLDKETRQDVLMLLPPNLIPREALEDWQTNYAFWA